MKGKSEQSPISASQLPIHAYGTGRIVPGFPPIRMMEMDNVITIVGGNHVVKVQSADDPGVSYGDAFEGREAFDFHFVGDRDASPCHGVTGGPPSVLHCLP